MKGITFICCVGALIIMVIPPGKTKGLSEEEERQRTMKREIELGLLAIEPPVINDMAVAYDSSIINQAEEDRDHLHHAPQRFQREYKKQPLRIQPREVLIGPEEDRDDLHHGKRKP